MYMPRESEVQASNDVFFLGNGEGYLQAVVKAVGIGLVVQGPPQGCVAPPET